ncbi:MAG: hypothetical protein U5L45_10805 [Saprospiraceae bacterium]|nr:hypothetical protein [Saprospiraceae bacterium]
MMFNALVVFSGNYLVTRSLRSRKRGKVVRFSGKARKTNDIHLFASEASYGLSNYF